MRYIFLILLLSTAAVAASYNIFNQPVLINSTLKVGAKTANTASAILEIVTTAKGAISCPKMTSTQRDAISTPVEGLCVFNTTSHKLNSYNGSAWTEVGGGGGGALILTGSRGSPQSITAAGGIAFTGDDARQLWFITGNGGPIDITANPQIAAATAVGQELILVGTNDTNFVTVEDGTGLSMDGPYDLTNDKVIGFVWDGTNWIEIFRR